MTSLFQILLMLIGVAKFIMIVHIVMSWLINFQILNPYQPFVANIWNGLNRLLEPIYTPVRNMLPNTGGLDLAPLAIFIGLIAAEIVIRNNLYAF